MADAGTRAAFTRGFWVLAPLWLGVIPFGLAYAVTARSAGLSLVETQALSVLVFAGSAQFSAVGLFAVGAAGLEIILTTLLLNVRHVLYGLSLGRELELTPARAPRGSVLPHRRGVRRRGGGEGALVPLPAGRRVEPLPRVEPGDARRLLLGAAIPDPGATRSRPHLPARVPRPARAASSTRGSSSSSRSPRAPWRSGSRGSSRADCRSC